MQKPVRVVAIAAFIASCALPVFANSNLATTRSATALLDADAPDIRDPRQQHELGVQYLQGDGVPRDEQKAFYWIHRAAEQGLPEAQASLGMLYGKGYGVARDEAEAIRWFRKAAEQGSATGQYNLGVAYAKGVGVAQDFVAAVKWLRQAAEQGDASAQYNLGIAYANGAHARAAATMARETLHFFMMV